MLWCLIGITLATSGAVAVAKCNCASCEVLARAEFDTFRLFDCSSLNQICTCLWRVLDIMWCAVPSFDQQSYDLKFNSLLEEESQYTRECRLCLLATRKETCNIQNVIQPKHAVENLDIGFAVTSISLEIYQLITVVLLKAEKVMTDNN